MHFAMEARMKRRVKDDVQRAGIKRHWRRIFKIYLEKVRNGIAC